MLEHRGSPRWLFQYQKGISKIFLLGFGLPLLLFQGVSLKTTRMNRWEENSHPGGSPWPDPAGLSVGVRDFAVTPQLTCWITPGTPKSMEKKSIFSDNSQLQTSGHGHRRLRPCFVSLPGDTTRAWSLGGRFPLKKSGLRAQTPASPPQTTTETSGSIPWIWETPSSKSSTPSPRHSQRGAHPPFFLGGGEGETPH